MASVRCCGATAGGFLQGSGEKEQFMSMGKILVADDDQNIAELLRLYLEKEGYTVVLAADGEQAIERFNA